MTFQTLFGVAMIGHTQTLYLKSSIQLDKHGLLKRRIMEEIKEMIMNHIVERYADASAEVTNGSNMLDSLNILSDAEYCKQIVDYVIDTKVKHGDRYDIATSVKFLKMEISENHIM